MGMDIFVENQNHKRIDQIHDDLDESVARFCSSGEPGTVRRGISRYGDTMLNEIQLRTLLEEYDALDRQDKVPALRQVAEGAYLAIRHRGYLWFSGD
jgi:hypothetical protein